MLLFCLCLQSQGQAKSGAVCTLVSSVFKVHSPVPGTEGPRDVCHLSDGVQLNVSLWVHTPSWSLLSGSLGPSRQLESPPLCWEFNDATTWPRRLETLPRPGCPVHRRVSVYCTARVCTASPFTEPSKELLPRCYSFLTFLIEELTVVFLKPCRYI